MANPVLLTGVVAVLAFSLLLVPASADNIYPGSTYGTNYTIETDSVDANQSCPYPIEATPGGQCPSFASDAGILGSTLFDLSDFDDNPPVVYVDASLLQFDGIDQTALTFTVTTSLEMVWRDDRGYAQIQASTAAAQTPSGKCNRYCNKDTQPGKTGYCCDGLWLPTLQFYLAQQKTFVEEDYQIQAWLASDSTNGLNYTYYSVTAKATYSQAFDFQAFPFDRHALNVRILCVDCLMARNSFYAGDAAVFATTTVSSENDTEGFNVNGKAIPPSSGWQLDQVDLALVNVSTSYDHDKPNAKQASSLDQAKEDPDFYGVIFIISTSRVTRAFYVLQVVVPPIILVLVGFVTFIIPRDKFVDRAKTQVTLLFPIFLIQFTIASILPKTYTLLSCHYLVFVSLILIAMLIGVAAISHLIIARQDHFEWQTKMHNGRERFGKRKKERKEGKALPVVKDVENGDQADGEAAVESCGHYAKAEKDEADRKKAEHNEAVESKTLKAQDGWRGTKKLRAWWSALAFNDVEGYREHIALYWEICALTLCFIIYLSCVLAIFLHFNQVGKNESTL